MSKSTADPDHSPPAYTESLSSPSYFPPHQHHQQQQRPGSSSAASDKPNPTTHLTTHLTNLPHLIRESREAHHESRAASDLALVSLVIPHVEALLHRFATRPVLPALAELTVVPAAAVPPGWHFANANASARPAKSSSGKGSSSSRSGGGGGSGSARADAEIHELVRVTVDKETAEKLRLDQAGSSSPSSTASTPGGGGGTSGDFTSDYTYAFSSSPSASSSSAAAAFNPSNPWQTRNEFDDWGRWGDDLGGGASSRNSPEALWWNDEELATRLARHLQPRHVPVPHRAPPGAIPSPAPTGVLTKEEPRPAPVPAASSRWSIFKSPDPVTPSPKPSPSFYYHTQQQQMGFPPLPSEEAVVMTVKAEEVTFRKENAFGIWESKNGYGLVVRVRTRR